MKAQLLWEEPGEGMFLALDFVEAYDSVRRPFLEAALIHLQLSANNVSQLVTALKGAVLFCLAQGYVPEVAMTPGSGVRQGDPLSPAVFSVLTVFLIYLVQPPLLDIVLLLYADNVPIYPAPPLRKHPESHQNDGNTGSRA